MVQTAVAPKVAKPFCHTKRKLNVVKALELRLKGYTYADIGKSLGVSRQGAQKALSKFGNLLDNPEAVNAYKMHEPDLISSAKLQVAVSLVDASKLEKASLNNAAYAFTQLNQAERLLRDQSTANISVRSEVVRLEGLRDSLQAELEDLGNE